MPVAVAFQWKSAVSSWLLIFSLFQCDDDNLTRGAEAEGDETTDASSDEE